jgi:hypothetical protein
MNVPRLAAKAPKVGWMCGVKVARVAGGRPAGKQADAQIGARHDARDPADLHYQRL